MDNSSKFPRSLAQLQQPSSETRCPAATGDLHAKNHRIPTLRQAEGHTPEEDNKKNA
jgi:hypothetical protein